ncbi:hypothetical protein H340_30708 [Streptomyces mobaraensis NBRC 13819 = DSM 40847]|uniref:Uncharacterized protein n=1 Tax=Streptomyces mobaraensis (strain ATCC 29032 / DSM 40847 / JCM 4168 / NBRC 13819 / NCIMB 11159 / IPCR 16-22) TaxID=1223523 RepID=M3BY75_STRM1|nr:hypothetical protein H340_30708 [Streptomyces mobaraensis NBRC 13819 = DSM 40847]
MSSGGTAGPRAGAGAAAAPVSAAARAAGAPAVRSSEPASAAPAMTLRRRNGFEDARDAEKSGEEGVAEEEFMWSMLLRRRPPDIRAFPHFAPDATLRKNPAPPQGRP